MPCKTCDHAMIKIGDMAGEIEPSFWCSRCGSTGDWRQAVPSLVTRCRNLEAILRASDSPLLTEWKRLGIAESISLPNNRPE